MIPELGHLALVTAFVLSIVAAGFALLRPYCPSQHQVVVLSMRAQFVLICISFAALSYAFAVNDFTVKYVVEHSNTLLPMHYKLTAVWGGHEGSILLWILILSLYSLFFSCNSQIREQLYIKSLGILALVSMGFLAFSLFTSNPFERHLPYFPMDGFDLNPLLQDIGLIIHPPILYLGYVGFSVPFALALGALLSNDGQKDWARHARKIGLIAWSFLTIGIMLGSWWAYYELGWGGWWFWDPVENASFMPWLVGTAFIHCVIISDKRDTKHHWSLLLAILAFCLSLLGTFLVRSGVLTSVHAFASDPGRGLFILLFLLVVVGGSLVVFFIHNHRFRQGSDFAFVSRESGLLANNLLLMVALFIVFLGTLYPLFIDVLGLGKLSVGPPYFNLMMTPLVLLFLIVLGVGSLLGWQRSALKPLFKPLMLLMIVSFALASAVFIGQPKFFIVIVTLAFAFWVILVQLYSLKQKRFRLNKSVFAMLMGHIGFAISIMGIVISSYYSIEKDMRLAPGDTISVAGYDFKLQSVDEIKGPNYHANRGVFLVTKEGKEIGRMTPEKRFYPVQSNVMTEAAIDPGLVRDLYIALGEALPEGAWSVRVYYKPFIRMIWLGALVIAFAGFVAAIGRRRSKNASVKVGEVNYG